MASAPDPAWPRLTRYRVVGRLGAGGMSEVFLALQESGDRFSRPVALKCLARSVRHHETYHSMFVREAGITAALAHPNVVKLYDLIFENEDAFMVMELVPGATLRELIKGRPDLSELLPVPLVVSVLLEVAAGLHYAHTFRDALGELRPVIHRDVNERNVMLAFDGAVRLLDFGIARQVGLLSNTAVGTVKGTLGYMAPEQLDGEQADARADVFALGVVAWQCLTGSKRFEHANDIPRLVAAVREESPPPSKHNRLVSPALDAVVLKALAPRREDRFSTAGEFGEALANAGVAPWSVAQRGELLSKVFAQRRAQLTRLLQGEGEETGFDKMITTERYDVAATVARLLGERGGSLLGTDAPTVPIPLSRGPTLPLASALPLGSTQPAGTTVPPGGVPVVKGVLLATPEPPTLDGTPRWDVPRVAGARGPSPVALWKKPWVMAIAAAALAGVAWLALR